MQGTDYRARITGLKCAVAIPTYNNAGTIADVIESVRQFSPYIIVVNDGSTDATADILSGIEGINVVTHPVNRGKGAAIKSAIAAASNAGMDYLISIDSDGQHSARNIPSFIEAIENNPDCFIIGARNLRSANMPGKNTFANKFSNFWFKIETGISLSDTQCGFRAYPLNRLKGMKFLTNGYEFEVESIVRAAWKGIGIMNIPIDVKYEPAGKRVSHFKPFRDFTRISILNAVLTICALIYFYPKRLIQRCMRADLKETMKVHVLGSRDSNLKMSASIAVGIFCSIIPVWGYQLVTAVAIAWLLKLNKVVAGIFSAASIPPAIPFIVYGCVLVGAAVTGEPLPESVASIRLENIGSGILQYIVGSFIVASAAALLAFGISYCLMHVCKRNPGGSQDI